MRILNDRIKDAMMEMGVPGMMRAVRTYVVDFGNMAFYPDAVLYSALKLPGVPQPGSAHRLDDRCLLSRARAVPLADRQAEIQLIYERVPLVTQNEDRITVPISTMSIPGTREQILASYSGEGWPTGELVRACPFTQRVPMRRLLIGKALFGYSAWDQDAPDLLPMSQLLSEEVKSSIGSVNDRYWMGKERGYWLAEGLKTVAIEPDDDFERSLCYYVTASFFTQEAHDWSFWRYLQLPNGQFAKVDPAVITRLKALGYDLSHAPGFRGYGDPIAGGTGVCVIYPYAGKDFYGIYGIQ